MNRNKSNFSRPLKTKNNYSYGSRQLQASKNNKSKDNPKKDQKRKGIGSESFYSKRLKDDKESNHGVKFKNEPSEDDRNRTPFRHYEVGYWSMKEENTPTSTKKVSLSSLCNVTPERSHKSELSLNNSCAKKSICKNDVLKTSSPKRLCSRFSEPTEKVALNGIKNDNFTNINNDGNSSHPYKSKFKRSRDSVRPKESLRKKLSDSFEDKSDVDGEPSSSKETESKLNEIQYDNSIEQENSGLETNLFDDNLICSSDSPISTNQLVTSSILLKKPNPKYFDLSTGFPNWGNKCYFISVLQCLLRIPIDLKEILTTIHRDWEMTYQTKFPEDSLIDNLIAILRDDISEEVLLKRRLRNIIDICSNGSTKFNDRNQEDAHEFLLHFLFDCFEKEISKYGNNSVLMTFKSLFKFEIRTNVRCVKCKANVSQINDTQNALSISIYDEPGLSLQNLINRYFEDEVVNDGSECNKCKCKNMEHLHFIENPPKYLIIQLMRFSYKNNASFKLSTKVKVNFYLNLDCALPSNEHPATDNDVLTESVKLRSPLNSIENHSPAKKTNEDSGKTIKFPPKSPLTCNNNLQVARQSTFVGAKPIAMKGGVFSKPISLKGGVSLPKNDAELETQNKDATYENVLNGTPSTQVVDEHFVLDQAKLDELTFEQQLVLAEQESLKDQDNDNDYQKALELSMREVEMPRSTESPELDFSSDVLDLEEEDESQGQYRLMGIVNHIGSYVSSGHYTAVVCDPETKVWHKYNDEHHFELDEKEIKSSCQSKGYLFFYVKK